MAAEKEWLAAQPDWLQRILEEHPVVDLRRARDLLTACGEGPVPESPIEVLLALYMEACVNENPQMWSEPRGTMLDFQYPVAAGGRTYRLDIMLSGEIAGFHVELGIECDGHNYHERTAEQAQHDKSRDRALVALGWTILRFTGSEINRFPRRCAIECLRTIHAIAGRKIGGDV